VFTLTTDNTAAGIVRHQDGAAFAVIKYGKGLTVDLNAELLAKGFARLNGMDLPEELSHYRQLEAEARAAGRGLWGLGGKRP
jgi:endonuclease YncB( thermonuclease family)